MSDTPTTAERVAEARACPHTTITACRALADGTIIGRCEACGDDTFPIYEPTIGVDEPDEPVAELGREIERLRAAYDAEHAARVAAETEVARLQAGGCARDQRTTQFCAEAVDAIRERDILRARVAELESAADGERVTARRAYILGYQSGHEDTVEGRYSGEPGERWDEDEQLRADIEQCKRLEKT